MASENTRAIESFNFKDFRFIDKISMNHKLDIALMQGINQPVSFVILVNNETGQTPPLMHFNEKGEAYNVGRGNGWEYYTSIEYFADTNHYGWVYPKTQTTQLYRLPRLPSYLQINAIKLQIAETFFLDLFSIIKDESILRFK